MTSTIGLHQGQPFKPESGKDIAARTGIIPIAVADGVVNEINVFFDSDVLTRDDANRLAAHAEIIFAHSHDFSRKLKRKYGRDTLWVFTRHWASALLKDKNPTLFRRLPTEFTVGHPLPKRTNV